MKVLCYFAVVYPFLLRRINRGLVTSRRLATWGGNGNECGAKAHFFLLFPSPLAKANGNGYSLIIYCRPALADGIKASVNRSFSSIGPGTKGIIAIVPIVTSCKNNPSPNQATCINPRH